MHIDHKFIQAILNPLKETVREASNAIMDVYQKDTYEKEKMMVRQ
jgi:hypothetical protein